MFVPSQGRLDANPRPRPYGNAAAVPRLNPGHAARPNQ